VVGEKQRLKAPLLDRPSQLVRPDREVAGKMAMPSFIAGLRYLVTIATRLLK
jgi:hypothetical protein